MASCRAPSTANAEWERKYQEYQAFQALCHAPPYTGPTETEPLPEGVKYIPCGDGRQFVIAWDGAREKGLAPAMDFAKRHMKDLHEAYGISEMGMGLCCDTEKAPPETRSYWCGRIGIVACSTTLPQFARTVADMRSHDGADALPIGVSIHVDGIRNEGPRCRPDDPKCGPTHARRAKPFDPKLPRKTKPNSGRGTCSHDGECNPVGCDHDACWSWQSGKKFGECFDPPRSPPVKAFCGCIEGQCSLFQQ
jgi:hypothetical protein